MIKFISLALFFCTLSSYFLLEPLSPVTSTQQRKATLSDQKCVLLDFNANRFQDNFFALKLTAREVCAGCRLTQTTTVIEMAATFCDFKATFVPATGAQIRIDPIEKEIELRGTDEAALRRQFLRLCEQQSIAVGQTLEVVFDENEVRLELENGVVKKYKGPVPIWLRAQAKDTCENAAVSIVKVTPRRDD